MCRIYDISHLNIQGVQGKVPFWDSRFWTVCYLSKGYKMVLTIHNDPKWSKRSIIFEKNGPELSKPEISEKYFSWDTLYILSSYIFEINTSMLRDFINFALLSFCPATCISAPGRHELAVPTLIRLVMFRQVSSWQVCDLVGWLYILFHFQASPDTHIWSFREQLPEKNIDSLQKLTPSPLHAFQATFSIFCKNKMLFSCIVYKKNCTMQLKPSLRIFSRNWEK